MAPTTGHLVGRGSSRSGPLSSTYFPNNKCKCWLSLLRRLRVCTTRGVGGGGDGCRDPVGWVEGVRSAFSLPSGGVGSGGEEWVFTLLPRVCNPLCDDPPTKGGFHEGDGQEGSHPDPGRTVTGHPWASRVRDGLSRFARPGLPSRFVGGAGGGEGPSSRLLDDGVVGGRGRTPLWGTLFGGRS